MLSRSAGSFPVRRLDVVTTGGPRSLVIMRFIGTRGDSDPAGDPTDHQEHQKCDRYHAQEHGHEFHGSPATDKLARPRADADRRR